MSILLKKTLLFWSIILGLQACQPNEYQYALTDEQLINILIDLHASNVMVKNFQVIDRDSVAGVYYDQILEIHEVSKEIFEVDLKNLNRNPKKMESIYGTISKQLEELKESPKEKSTSKE